MPSKRDLLSLLSRQELIDFVENYGIDVPDRRNKAQLVASSASLQTLMKSFASFGSPGGSRLQPVSAR